MLRCEDYLPHSSLLWSGKVVHRPSIAACEKRVDANASNMDCKVTQRNIIFGGLSFRKENSVCNDEESLGTGNERHPPRVLICEKR